MRIFSIAAVAAAALTLGVTLVGHVYASRQADQSNPFHIKMLGNQAAQAGVIHATGRGTPDTVPTTPTVYNGTYELTFNLDVKSTFPAGTKIWCEAEISVEGFYDETEFGQASGNTCVVKMPYSWLLPKASTGVVDFNFTGKYAVIATDPAITEPPALRETTETFLDAETGVAASGTTTSYTFNVTI
jgi:hypothetical protein